MNCILCVCLAGYYVCADNNTSGSFVCRSHIAEAVEYEIREGVDTSIEIVVVTSAEMDAIEMDRRDAYNPLREVRVETAVYHKQTGEIEWKFYSVEPLEKAARFIGYGTNRHFYRAMDVVTNTQLLPPPTQI